MRQKIAFLRMWPSPPIATSVTHLLMDTFPEFEIKIFDVARLIRNEIITTAINVCVVYLMYGIGILRGKRQFNTCFWRTPFIFRRIKKLITRLVSENEYAFTFQLGSIFDGSVEGVHHFIYTDHTHLENLNYPTFDPSQLFAQRWISLERKIYHSASMVFSRSTNITNSLIEHYDVPSQKIACVYSGINVIPPNGGLDTRQYQNENILFVGGDWRRKGGDDLVRAFEIVLKSFPDARLTVVGSNPIIDLPNCQVVGNTLVDEVSQYYKNASLFCLPTYQEPFGAVFIEAFSYKLPIVATNIGAIPDFVLDGQNGFLVEPGDVEGLAKALIELISSPGKCAEFGEKGNKLVQERYNWQAVGAAMREHIFTNLNS